tara:strand:+ start:169 stop:540 length:372 start_codon:yes stop_codon:yes gene_type:complete
MVDYNTLVIGASVNPDRYSHKVVLKLLDSGIKVIPMGINQGNIADLVIVRPFEKQKNIHTVSIYIKPEIQKEYYKYIINLQPKRVLFNPGTENPIFSQILQKHNIYWENSCSLVLLSTNQYQS